MNDLPVSDQLRAIIADLDQVRRCLVADEPRRTTFQWAERAKRNADTILARVEMEQRPYLQAAE